MVKKKTTLNLNETLLKKLKIISIEKDITLTNLVDLILSEYVEKFEK